MQLSLCLVPALPEELREATSTPRRIGWASLLARVFAIDVTVCSKCGGRMKILEVVTDPAARVNTAITLHHRRRPDDGPEILGLLREALAAAREHSFPVETRQIEDIMQKLGLPVP